MTTEQKERICVTFTQIRNDGCRLTYDPDRNLYALIGKKNEFIQYISKDEVISYLRSSIAWAKAAVEDTDHHIRMRRQRITKAEILLSELETK